MAALVKPFPEPDGERQGVQFPNSAGELALNLAANAGSSHQKSILDALPVFVFIEKAGRIVFANAEARHMLDVDAVEWAERGIEEVLWGLLPGTAEPQTRLKGTRCSRPFHATMPVPGGRMMPVEGTYSIFGESRSEAVIVAWPGDHERAPKSNFMEDVLACLPEAVAIVHGNHILYTNPAFTRMFGYTSEEIEGCSMSKLMMKEANPFENVTLAALLEDNGNGSFNATIRGPVMNLSLEVAPLMVNEEFAGRVITFREAPRQDGTGYCQLTEALENHWGPGVVPHP